MKQTMYPMKNLIVTVFTVFDDVCKITENGLRYFELIFNLWMYRIHKIQILNAVNEYPI